MQIRGDITMKDWRDPKDVQYGIKATTRFTLTIRSIELAKMTNIRFPSEQKKKKNKQGKVVVPQTISNYLPWGGYIRRILWRLVSWRVWRRFLFCFWAVVVQDRKRSAWTTSRFQSLKHQLNQKSTCKKQADKSYSISKATNSYLCCERSLLLI